MVRNSAVRAAGFHGRADSFYVFANRKCRFVMRAASLWALQVFRFVFSFFAKGKVTRPDLVPQLITASQTLQMTGDSELSVDSHWRQNVGQTHEHRQAEGRDAAQTKHQSA